MTYEHVLACTLRMRCDHNCANKQLTNVATGATGSEVKH